MYRYGRWVCGKQDSHVKKSMNIAISEGKMYKTDFLKTSERREDVKIEG